MKNNMMKTVLSLVVGCVALLALASCGGKEKAIVGTWEVDSTEDGARVEFRTSYAENGTSSSMGTITAGWQTISVLISGTWSVDGDKLHEKITSSNVPNLMPVGFESTSTIIELTDNVLVTEFMGKRTTGQRVAD